MNFIIGFGSIEKQFEQSEEEAFVAFAADEYRKESEGYVTDDLAAKVRDWFAKRALESQERADAYKDAPNYPDRYSRYWVTVMDDASNLVAIVRFHHINRKHALSPDGWAVMQTKRIFHVSTTDELRRPESENG